MARIKDASVEAVNAAADMVDVVSARTQLRKVGSRYTGRCPFHEERTPSFSVNPVDKLYYCFGCGKGGDVITFVRETEQLDFVERDRVAGRALPRPARVRGDVAAGRGVAEAPRPAPRGARAGGGVLRAAPLGDGGAASRCASTSQARGLGEPVCREFRLGLSPGDGLARRRSRRASRGTSCAPPGSTNARGNDYFPQRLMFPLADARGRVVGFQARKLRRGRPAAREVRELARGRALPQVGDPLRAPPRPARDREAGARRSSSRGTPT